MAKIIFYTAQTGTRGFIPSIKEQKIPEFDYYFFHDNHIQAEANKGWNYRNILHEYRQLPNPKRQRLIKMCPHLFFFEEYDYTVWVDCKFYQHKDFYKLCLEIIQKEKPNFMVCQHKENRTFQQELDFAEQHKFIPVNDLDTVKEHKIGEFYSTDTCWLIRKNTEENNMLGLQWFNLTNVCFQNECRDQLTISSCIRKDYLNMNHTIEELEKYSFIRHV
jgi:hypothetical protein